MMIDAHDLTAMKNHAAGSRISGQADPATVTEFVALAKQAPRDKQIKIADTLVGRVRAGQPMNHNGRPMTLATMAAIVVALA